ncbi:MAG: PhoPQ-activated pathogenicity-related family protein [Armatimonadota bacterium]
MRKRLVYSLAAVLCTLLAGAACASLSGYLETKEPEYRWSKESESTVGDVRVVNLRLRSQVWRGIPWDHHLQLFLPKKVSHPKTALLLVTGGDPGQSSTLLAASLAPRLEGPAAVLYNIPNQPLLDGKREDDLIAHTFQEYLKTGDPTWPLLFPMVKSAVKAMDALQEYSRRELPAGIEDFVVTGASKRGWTTYLTGATDPRVRAIAPMVFDNLNFHKQLPRQLELWGKYSEQIDDYTRRGLQQQLQTPRGRQLVSMVDPWYYRDRLKMPKLLLHGANDRYWSTDSTRLYWNDLPGDKYLLSIPNAGHGLEDRGRLLNALTAFFHAVAQDRKLPALDLNQERNGEEIRLKLVAGERPKAVRLWTARAMNTDFRPVKWADSPMVENGKGYDAAVPAGPGGLALFAEAEFESGGRTYTLTTPASVYGVQEQAASR